MAITVDYVILPHLKKEDGTNFIRIRVTHQRKSKYIKTNICVEPEDLTRSGNLKHQGKRDLADEEVKRWRKEVDQMTTYAVQDMSVSDVVRYIQARMLERESFRLNFAEYGRTLASTKKENTKRTYHSTIQSLCRFFGYEPDISEITVRSLRDFEDFLRNDKKQSYSVRRNEKKEQTETKSDRTVSCYLSTMRAIYKKARKEFNDPDLDIMRIPVDIFEYYNVPVVKRIEPRDIPLEWVQMMIDQRKGLRGRQRLGVDMFLVSFGLMGINIVDMYQCEKANGGVIHYFRTKTTDKKEDKAEMYVRIEPCIQAILREYKDKSRLLDLYRRYAGIDNTTLAVNDGLRQWIEKNKLKKDFTFYSARHTWATLGASKAVGLDLSIVTEGLSHSNQSRRMDMVYIRKDWERVWEANAKVLAQLKW